MEAISLQPNTTVHAMHQTEQLTLQVCNISRYIVSAQAYNARGYVVYCRICSKTHSSSLKRQQIHDETLHKLHRHAEDQNACSHTQTEQQESLLIKVESPYPMQAGFVHLQSHNIASSRIHTYALHSFCRLCKEQTKDAH